MHWRSREYYPAGTKVNVEAKLYGLAFGDGAYGKQDFSLNFNIGRRQVVKAEVSVAPHPGSPRRGRHHGLRLQLRRSRQAAQRHAQRHPRGQREVLRLLHVQPGRRLQPCPRTLGGADLQQRRVHPRQPVQRGRAGQHQRHQRLHQPVDRPTPSSTSAARSTATRSRSPAARSSCPTPTATSGTGPWTGTPGSGMSALPPSNAEPSRRRSRFRAARRPPRTTHRRCRAPRPTTSSRARPGG